MSIVSALFNKSAYSLEDAFKAKDITSPAMREAIMDWFDLYMAKKPHGDEDPCQQIPGTIVRKISTTAFSEYNASSKDEFVERALESLDKYKTTALQAALIGGECLLKPIPEDDAWRWTVIRRNDMLVFGRGDDGGLMDVGTAEYTTNSNGYYTLLERRTVDERGYLTIRYALYHSNTSGQLGVPVSLQSLEQYANLQPEYTFTKPVGSIGLVPLRTPMENCVDGGADAVSVYAAAVGLIHNINRNEFQLNTEFENGESRVFVSADLMSRDSDGRRKFRDHIFVGLDDDAESVGVTIFSPELREQSFLARKTEYLRNVESVIGLKRGLLSEVEAAERTAKEITSSEGDYNLTIISFQRAWESAAKEAVRLCGALGQLYGVAGAHEVNEDDISFDWGNGVLFDEDKTWADYLDMVARGMLKPEIAMGWRFGMPTETPGDLQKIREKYMPELESMAGEE